MQDQLLLLREQLHLAHTSEQVEVAADYLLAERKRLNDPLGMTVAYKNEASAVFDLFVQETGMNRRLVRARIHRTLNEKRKGE